MAATQNGTGSLTVAGQAAAAARYITVPSGCIVESVSYQGGGAPAFEDVMDQDGALHTRVTFEKTMHKATIVIVGKAYASAAGAMDGDDGALDIKDYYVESVSEETSKGPVRTTITLTHLPTVST